LVTALYKEFSDLLGDECVSACPADCAAYAYDAAGTAFVPPTLVLRPGNADQIAPVMELCRREGLHLVIRGAGTGLRGHATPGGADTILLALDRLCRIFSIEAEDRTAHVECGVTAAALAAAAAARGLWYPPDPGSMCVSTLGGNVAEDALGPHGLKYGSSRHYLLGMDICTPSGVTAYCPATAPHGLPLAQLVAGSGGQLAVMSRLRLRLLPPPAAKASLCASFGDTAQAAQAAAAIMASPLCPAALELLDALARQALDAYAVTGLPQEGESILLLELDGHPAQVSDDMKVARTLLTEQGCQSLHQLDTQQTEAFFVARRALPTALRRLGQNTLCISTRLPCTRQPELCRALAVLSERHRLRMACFGHAGSGLLHPVLLPDAGQDVQEALGELFHVVQELGGTLEGGPELGQGPWLAQPVAAPPPLERGIQQVFDPTGLLYPGNILTLQQAQTCRSDG